MENLRFYTVTSKNRGHFVLSLTPLACKSPPVVLSWYMDLLEGFYLKNVSGKASFHTEDSSHRGAYDLAAGDFEGNLSGSALLLLSIVKTGLLSPSQSDMGDSFRVLSLLWERLPQLKDMNPLPKPVKYSIRKSKAPSGSDVMTLRTDVVKELGIEGAFFFLFALRSGLVRERGRSISPYGMPEELDPPPSPPESRSLHMHIVSMLFQNWLETLSSAEAKEKMAEIKVIADFLAMG